MRTVLDNDSVAHLWAHQAQPHGRNDNDSLSFDGPTLRSYATAIARIVTNRRGETAVVYNTRKYSVTTSGHLYRALSATSHLPRLGLPSLWENPARQVEALGEHLEQLAESAATARNRVSRAKRFDAYLSALRTANAYCTFLDLKPFPVPDLADLEKTATGIREAIEARQRKEQAKAKREVARRDREGRKQLAEWFAGGPSRPYGLRTAYARLEGDTLVTTEGASVPAAHVRRLAPMILDLVAAGEDWRPDTERPIRLGHYQLDRIGPDGTVHIGCHRFERSEIERIAGLLGVGAAECAAEPARELAIA